MIPVASTIATALKGTGCMPDPHFLTATLTVADTSGEINITTAARATIEPPRRSKSSAKMTAMPAKPRPVPISAGTVIRSSGSAKCAITATSNGKVANSTDARPDGTHCSHQKTTPYETQKDSSACNNLRRRSRRLVAARGIFITRATPMSRTDAIANRRATPVKGGIPRNEIVIAAQVVPHTRVRKPRVATFNRGPGADIVVDSTPI